MRTLDFIENEMLRRDLPPFKVGDTVAVHVTRARRRQGAHPGLPGPRDPPPRRRAPSETFTVRKISSGVGVERVFPVQSPLVTKVEIKARGYVRRSRLYYLRNLSGKKARLHSKVRDLSGLISEEEAEALANAGESRRTWRPVEVEATEAAANATEEADREPRPARSSRARPSKKAKAAEKAKRMEKLKAEEADRAAKKAKEEAEAAAAAEAEGEADAAGAEENAD